MGSNGKGKKSDVGAGGQGRSEPMPARRFPVFDVPEDAPVIPAARIQKAIDEGLA